MLTRRRIALVIAVGVAMMSFSFVPAGQAAAPSWVKVGLTRKAGACTANQCHRPGRHVIDPINVVWYGRGAIAGAVAHRMVKIGWSHDDRNSPVGEPATQNILTTNPYARCPSESVPRATHCWSCERDHVRSTRPS